MITKNAITVGRISSTKQGLIGDSLSDQENQILLSIKRIEASQNCKIKVIKDFEFTESASVEFSFQPLLKAIDFAKNPQNNIDFIFIKSIDRATRGGATIYGMLKEQLTKANVTLVDVYGVINSNTVNTLAHHDMEYSWSTYNPSWITELLEAERAKSEVRDILTRMIGAEINYVRLGYWIGQSPYGYQTVKKDTPHGKRSVLLHQESESKYIVKMFELRTRGSLSDQQIIDEINELGFKTRVQNLRDKHNRNKIIGYRGGVPLSIKQLQRYIQNPIYTGINMHKWTQGQPIKQTFKGIVTIDEFNQANKGKITILKDGKDIQIIKGKIKPWLVKRNKDNPNYPYRKYVSCPVCRKPLIGSAPMNKAGNNIPRYHCSRKHKYWSINQKKFNITLEAFVKNIKFTPQFIKKFRKILLEEWEKRRLNVQDDNVTITENIAQIEKEQAIVMEKIKILSSVLVIKKLEEEIEKLETERKQLLTTKNKKEIQKVNIQTVIKYLRYYMEHFEELLIDEDKPLESAELFGLCFTELPTYEDLVNGTPKFNSLIKLSEEYKSTNRLNVIPRGVEPRFLG